MLIKHTLARFWNGIKQICLLQSVLLTGISQELTKDDLLRFKLLSILKSHQPILSIPEKLFTETEIHALFISWIMEYPKIPLSTFVPSSGKTSEYNFFMANETCWNQLHWYLLIPETCQIKLKPNKEEINYITQATLHTHPFNCKIPTTKYVCCLKLKNQFLLVH